MDLRRFLCVGLVVCSIPYLGCASKSGSNGLRSSSGSALSKSSTTAPFNDPRYQNLVEKIEADGGTTSYDQEPDSTAGKIGSAVKKATSSVTSALTLKPKVIKAHDPVSLSSMPEHINVAVIYQAGRLAESKGDRAAAIKQYTRAVEEAPEHLPSLISLARLHDRDENFSEAQRLYRKAIKAEPGNAMAYNDLGLCLARNDRDEESIAALGQAISLEPSSKLYRNNLATVLVDMGRVDAAWNELAGAHSPAVAHYNLGYLLFENGDKQQAQRQFQLAVQKDPALTAAQDMLARFDGPRPEQSAAAEKVRFRVDDLMTQVAPSAPAGALRARPVAMVVSPRELRRIPPTDSPEDNGPPKPPTIRLHQPVPTGPQLQPAPLGTPVVPIQPQSGIQFPGRTMSGTMVQDSEDADLPTPELLNEVAQN